MTTITTRADKGAELTYQELDDNFDNLNTDKLETTGGTLTGNLTFATGDDGIIFSDATVITSASGLGTTYTVSAETATGGANLRLTGSDTTTDDVGIVGSGATTVSRTDANTITISSTDTNTHLVDSVNGATGVVVLDTDDIAEGSANLYYTDTRANAAIDARVIKSFVDALNVDADTLDGIDSTGFATAAQGSLADSALQNVVEDTTPQLGGNLDAQGFSISNVSDTETDRVSFDHTASLTPALGEITWFGDDSTLAVGLVDGVTGLLFQDSMIRIKASGAINKGQAVMFAGVQGENIQGKITDFDSVGFRPEFVIGIAANTMVNNEEGYVLVQGKVKDIDTSAFSVGDILYANPAVDGGVTVTVPSAPNAKVELAAVLKSNATEGILQVRARINPRLEDLTDVETAAPSDNDFLRYEDSTDVWLHEPLDISYDTTPQLGGNLEVASFNFSNVGSYTGSGTLTVNTGDHTVNAFNSTTGAMTHSGNAFFGRAFATAFFQPGNLYVNKTMGRLFATATSGTHSGGGSADGATRTTIDTLHVSAFEFSLTANRTIRFINRNAGRTNNSTSNGITINTAGTYQYYIFWFTQDATGSRTVTWRTIANNASTELEPTLKERGSLGTDANQLTLARVWVKYGTSGNATDIRVIYETF